MNSLPRALLPSTVEIFVGSGADVHHAIELSTTLVDLGVQVDIRLSMGPAAAVPRAVWLTLAGCRHVRVASDVWSAAIPEVPQRVLRVGFAAETDTGLEKARQKRVARGFDVLCLNDVGRSDTGFEVETNKVWVLTAEGGVMETPVLSKDAIAERILDVVERALASASAAAR